MTTASALFAALGLRLSGDLTVGDLLVGVGTLLLAGFTFWLALSTRASVREAARAVDAEDMPYVIAAAVPDNVDVAIKVGRAEFPRCGVVTWDGLGFAARLWNIGRGPAIVEDVRLVLGGAECLDPVISTRPVHAGGAHDALWDDFHPPGDDWEERNLAGVLTVVYAHANGVLWKTTSEVRLHRRHLLLDTFARSRADAKDVRGRAA